MFLRFLLLHEARGVNSLVTLYAFLGIGLVGMWIATGMKGHITVLGVALLLLLAGGFIVAIPFVLIPGYQHYRNARLARRRRRAK